MLMQKDVQNTTDSDADNNALSYQELSYNVALVSGKVILKIF